MSDSGGTRPQPAATAVLAVVILALLVAGGVGIATHHSKSDKSVVAVVPAGFQTVVDANDHVSFAVPAGVEGADPSRRHLGWPGGHAEEDRSAAGRPGQPGVDFGEEPAARRGRHGPPARTTLVTISFDAAGVDKVSQIPVASVEDPLIKQGAKNIEAARIRLPVGNGEQVSNQLPVGTTTVSEVAFYFVRGGRVTEVILVSLDSQPPKALAQQIEASVAAA